MKPLSLQSPQFLYEDQAFEYLEGIRWSNGPVCPHCGNTEKAYKIAGKSTRMGLYKCGKCKKQFTVTVGTLFEGSHIPLHKWLSAVFMICSSKKGMSAHQLHRMLGITYKSAWFMAHRIRTAMKSPETNKLGGEGKIVEVDETFWGNNQQEGIRGWGHKMKIFTLVERDGDARSFHVPSVTAKTLKPIMHKHIVENTRIMTDDCTVYRGLKKEFDEHSVVRHSKKEYVCGDVHTNTVEGFFSLLKRGLIGTFHHVGEQHLVVSQFEFDKDR